MQDNEERIQKYEAELARLDELHAHLDSLWEQVPRYGLVGLAAPFVWYYAGFGWAVSELLVTAALVGTQAYLIGVRKNENRWNYNSVRHDLDRLRTPGGTAGDSAA
ncbi:MAG: hypothetical protein RL385_4276, partial [Pseudomonadota bacterium]|jgi:hypothetical protein